MGAKLGELSLLKTGITAEKRFTGRQPQHRVSQKFHLLVVFAATVAVLRARRRLVRVRSMRKRPFQKLTMLEAMTERTFQRGQLTLLHTAQLLILRTRRRRWLRRRRSGSGSARGRGVRWRSACLWSGGARRQLPQALALLLGKVLHHRPLRLRRDINRFVCRLQGFRLFLLVIERDR